MKKPCDSNSLENTKNKICLKGSPWVSLMQNQLGGNTQDKGVTVDTNDNFHMITSLTSHLPKIYNDCSGSSSCILKGATVSNNKYNIVNKFDFGQFPNAAVEQLALMNSRQIIQKDSGHSNTNFDQLDGGNTRCAELNQQALSWALKQADSNALRNYNSIGNKLVIGKDIPVSSGIEWVSKEL